MNIFDLLIVVVTYYVQLLAIMNPFSVIPTFLGMTQGLDYSEVSRVVKRAMLAGLTIVVLFTLAGNYVLEVFNVSIPGLRVGGGIILLVIAIDMLGEEPRTKRMPKEDIAVVPIATPLIIGPGTITTILLLTASKPGDLLNTGFVLLSGVLACITSFMILKLSRDIARYLRVSVIRALGRFMALIIAGVATELIATGIKMYYEAFTG
ncbi:MAG: MarC family protein [Candidatus Aenigmatarchaeota archaeon]